MAGKYGTPPLPLPLPSPGSSKPTQILEWTIICISGHHLNTSPYRILPIFVFFGVLDSVIICFQLFLPSGRSAWVGRSVGSRRRVSKSCAPKIFLPKTRFWEKIGGAQLLDPRLREHTIRATRADHPERRNNGKQVFADSKSIKNTKIGKIRYGEVFK